MNIEDIKCMRMSKYTLLISSNNDRYYDISKYIGKQYTKQYYGSDDFSQVRLYEVNIRSENNEILYGIPYDKSIMLKFHDNEILCKLTKLSDYHGTNCGIHFVSELSLTADNETIIEDLINLSVKNDTKMLIYHYNSLNNYWKRFGNIQIRDENTLIIDKNIKENLLSDISNFITSEKDYIKYGIPYKRNYLFYGQPGTGKTSFAKIMANKTKRSIYIISFDTNLTDTGLYNAINNINNENAILLLEDIDCIFQNRTLNTSNSKISFSSLLNILDGITTPYGLITIITTNYINKLDKALIRPGRVDMSVKFSKITQEQINGLLELYNCNLSHKSINQIIKICTIQSLSASTLSGFLFRNIHNNLDDSNIIKIFNNYLNEMNITDRTNDNNMYL